MSRPRALIVAPMLPSRTGNGLAMRLALFVEAIETFADLDVRVLPVAGRPAGGLSSFRTSTRIEVVDPPTSTIYHSLLRIDPADARLTAIRHYGLPFMSSFLSGAVLTRLSRGMNAYDLIHIARSYMLPVVETVDRAVPLSVDLDEDDFVDLSGQATHRRRREPGFAADWLDAEAVACDRLIDRYIRHAGVVFASCRADRLSLQARHGDLVIAGAANAVMLPPHPVRRDDGETIAFVGSFGYGPNREGVAWFMAKVLPRLRVARPAGFRIVLAGSAPPEAIAFQARHPRVHLVGDFADPAEIYRRATICIAPMQTGGGLRTKIVEAAAHGVACVSHRSCAITKPGAPIGWVANDARGFADACAAALTNVAGRRYREREARRYVARHYDRRHVVADLAATLRDLAGT